MSRFDFLWNRLSTLVEITERSPNKKLGHTAIMKLVYFLQTLKKVPLGYHFQLYMYGPYDSSVLGDLRYAEFLGIAKSETVSYPQGSGYLVSAGPEAERIKQRARGFLQRYEKDIEEVVQEFGDRSAADIEMLSTIVYADQELQEKNRRKPPREMAETVQKIKPRFTVKRIQEEVEALLDKGFLSAVKQ